MPAEAGLEEGKKASWLPLREQLLTISSEGRTRIVRLGSGTQVAILLASAAIVAWIAAATSIALVGALQPMPGNGGKQFQTDIAQQVIQLESKTEELERLNIEYREWGQALFDAAFDQSVELAELQTQIKEYESIAAARDAASSRTALIDGHDRSLLGFRSTEEQAEFIPARRAEALFEAIDGTVESLEGARNRIAELNQEIADLRQDAERRKRRSEQIVSEILDTVVAISTDLEQIFDSAGVSVDDLEDGAREAFYGQGGPSNPIPAGLDAGGAFPPGTGIDSLIEIVNRLNNYKIFYQGTPFGYPVRGPHAFTSGFGMRRHPIKKNRQMHTGIDLAASPGTAIHATGDGKVTFAGSNGSYGLQVEIRHLGGISSTYSHLEKIYVKKGQSVSRNQQIGAMGSTGVSTGPHLHYEIIVDGKMVDPLKFIEAEANVF